MKKFTVTYLKNVLEAELAVINTDKGQITILPLHENIVLHGEIVYVKNNNEITYINQTGAMIFQNNNLIFLN